MQVEVNESGVATWTIRADFEEHPGFAQDSATLDLTVETVDPEPLDPGTATLLARVDEDNNVILRTQTFDNALYTWSRDGVIIATTSEPEYTDPGVAPGTYEYEVSIEYDLIDPETGVVERVTISATRTVTIAEEGQPTPSLDLGLSHDPRGGVLMTATYTLTNPDGSLAPIPDDTRYVWSRGGRELATTRDPSYHDPNPYGVREILNSRSFKLYFNIASPSPR